MKRIGTQNCRSLAKAQDRRGTVMAEYACVLSVIAAIIITAVPTVSASFPNPLRSAEEPSDTDATPQAAAQAPLQVSTTDHETTENLYLMEIGLLVMACVLALWALRRYRKTHRKLEEGELALYDAVSNLTETMLQKRQQIQLAISSHWHTKRSTDLVAAELMTRSLETVNSTTTRENLTEFLQTTGRHHVLVADDQRLLGVVSDRDLIDRDGDTAKELMSQSLVTVAPSTSINETISTMLANRISCVPVTDNERICGVVTMSDVAMGLQCTLRALDQIAHAISDPFEALPA